MTRVRTLIRLTLLLRPQRWLETVRGYTTIAAGTAAARLFAFVAGIIVARSLGPAGFGEFSIFLALMILFSRSGEFITATYVRHVTAPDVKERHEYLRGALALTGVLFLLLVLLAYPLGMFLAHVVFNRPDLWFAAAMAVLCGSGLVLISMRSSEFLARRRLRMFAVMTGLFYALILLVLLPVYIGGLELEPSTLYVLFVATSVSVGLLAILSLVPATRPFRFETETVSKMFRYAKWLLAGSLVFIVAERLDILLLARYVPSEELGQYGAALRYIVVAVLLIGALSSFMLPKVAQTRTSRAGLLRWFRESFLLAGMLIAAIFALWLTAPFLVTQLFGEEFSSASHLARILLIGAMLSAIGFPFWYILLAEEVPRQVLVMSALRLVTILSVVVLLVPRIGIDGAAWASVSAEAVALAYSVVVFLRLWPSRYRAMPLEDESTVPGAEGTMYLAKE